MENRVLDMPVSKEVIPILLTLIYGRSRVAEGYLHRVRDWHDDVLVQHKVDPEMDTQLDNRSVSMPLQQRKSLLLW
jgi:hypothetical protein